MTTFDEFFDTLQKFQKRYDELVGQFMTDPTEERTIKLNDMLYAMYKCDNLLKEVLE